jgi:glutamate synthase (NADPH/NADH) large chain
MSGGIAYVLDLEGDFAKRCNTAMVDLEPVLSESEQQGKLGRELWHHGQADEVLLRGLIERHAKHTGSKRAQQILEKWASFRTRFVKVFPKEYRRALGELAAAQKKAAA